MALADAIKVQPVVRRRCRICREPVVLTIDAKGKPVVESCSCRAANKRAVVPSDWNKMEALMPTST